MTEVPMLNAFRGILCKSTISQIKDDWILEILVTIRNLKYVIFNINKLPC